MVKITIFLSLLSALFSCSTNHLSISQVKVDRTYLASTHAHTPDPRQANPPYGQMLIIDWNIPNQVFKKKPQIAVTIIFKNFTQEVICYPMHKSFGHKLYFLLNKEYEERKGILTYKAEIITDNKEIYKEWKHQLWVNLINIDHEEEHKEEVAQSLSSAEQISSSVSDQSMQGSVIETSDLISEESSN